MTKFSVLCTLHLKVQPGFYYHVDIGKGLAQRFSVFEEGDFASRQSLQTFQAFLKTIFLLKVQVRLELDQRLVLENKKLCLPLSKHVHRRISRHLPIIIV